MGIIMNNTNHKKSMMISQKRRRSYDLANSMIGSGKIIESLGIKTQRSYSRLRSSTCLYEESTKPETRTRKRTSKEKRKNQKAEKKNTRERKSLY